jgi:ferredoxin
VTAHDRPAGPVDIAVVLCASLGDDAFLDLAQLERRIRETLPQTRVEIMPSLGVRPGQIRKLDDRLGAPRLVLGVREETFDRRALDAAIRKSGLDVNGVEAVVLTDEHAVSPEAVDESVLRLQAAAARLAVFSGTGAEHLRPRLLSSDEPVSRRSLFTMPPLTYETVPGIDVDSCLGPRACSLCVQRCPVRAISASGGSLAVDRAACITCGACVSTCPVGAVRFPGSDLAQREAELDIFLSRQQRPIVFACKGFGRSHTDGTGESEQRSRRIEVPCLGSVTVGWILQALAGGAPAVTLMSCGDACRAAQWPVMRSRVEVVERLLAELGEVDPAGRVRIVSSELEPLAASPPRPPRPGVGPRPRVTLTEPRATAEAFIRLAGEYGVGDDVRLAHPASPLGFVTVREDTCTTCGTCAGVCPTGALTIADGAGQSGVRELSFDPRLCVACGRCASSCPEAAFDTVTVEHAMHHDDLERGRRTVARSTHTLCEMCGRSVAPSAMLDRIGAMLEGEDGSDALLRTLRRLCSDCRGLVRETPGVKS